MKRVLIITGVALLLAGIWTTLTVFYNSGQEEDIMRGFSALQGEDEVTAAEMIRYLDEHIADVSRKNAAIMVLGLEEFQKTNLPEWERRYINDLLQKEVASAYPKGVTRESVDAIGADNAKRIVIATLDNGYKIETAEGFFFPVIDYTFMLKYKPALTPDIADYLEIMAVESDIAPMKDAALMIGWDEVIRRALRQERYLKEHPNSSRAQAMVELLERYVSFAIFGGNNTPLFSYQTKEIVPEAKRAYLTRDWDRESGVFSAVMEEYLEVLEANSYRLTPEVEAYRDKVFENTQETIDK